MSLKLVKKGLGLLLATGEILNTTDEVEKISKTHFFKEVSEVVLGLQNCSVAFIDAKNGFLTKFHIEMVIQKKSQLFFFVEKYFFFENEQKYSSKSIFHFFHF